MPKQNKKRKPYNGEEDDEIELNKKQCIAMCAKCDQTELKEIGTFCVKCKWCKNCYLDNICGECSVCVNCHEPFRSCEITRQTEYSRNLYLRYRRNEPLVNRIISKIPDCSSLKTKLCNINRKCKYEWKYPLSMEQIMKYVEISLLLDDVENTLQNCYKFRIQ